MSNARGERLLVWAGIQLAGWRPGVVVAFIGPAHGLGPGAALRGIGFLQFGRRFGRECDRVACWGGGLSHGLHLAIDPRSRHLHPFAFARLSQLGLQRAGFLA